MNKLLVIGSANADHVLAFDSLPQAGETLLSRDYRLELGGKGANQAVAATRLKSSTQQVDFICALGDDGNGELMRKAWQKDELELSGCYGIAEQSTGTAMIFVSSSGENSIGVVAGANACLSPEHITEQQDKFAQASYLLIQLETPLDTVLAALKLAKEHDCTTILNPAPAANLPKALLSLVDIITPNETEAQALTDIKVTDTASAAKAAEQLHGYGINTVVITLGSQGAYLSVQTTKEIVSELIPAFAVTAIDTVAAGDTFNGGLMVALDEGCSIKEAVIFANKASAIAVTRHGAQRGIPYRAEVTNERTV
ncbi:ribokinase [uncultured Shewanella sp.]|uniref:ribokinase n=1 Tax=uncultured Shewanella sp. TaxID=173975 RepID=UPI00262855EC|nr:ribokinase [uncultured Shewanella sp.]